MVNKWTRTWHEEGLPKDLPKRLKRKFKLKTRRRWAANNKILKGCCIPFAELTQSTRRAIMRDRNPFLTRDMHERRLKKQIGRGLKYGGVRIVDNHIDVF